MISLFNQLAEEWCATLFRCFRCKGNWYVIIVGNCSSYGLIVSALATSVKLASGRRRSFCNYRLIKGFISYRNLFNFLLRFVVLKRPGFQPQKYGMPIYALASLNSTLSRSEYVTTNVTAKQDTFPREPNPCYTVVFHMCSCKTITVARK